MTDSEASRLNRNCYCVTLDRSALKSALAEQFPCSGADFPSATIPDLDPFFSDNAVFVARADIVKMREVVQAIEAASQLPAYLEKALSWAPDIAQFAPGPIGAFMGYDFHLGTDGPQLIEVNTNAGGAFLNVELARAQRRCCSQAQHSSASSVKLEEFNNAVFDMFTQEWQRQRPHSYLKCVAIVDNDPKNQFLYPEFQLAQQLFSSRGIDAVIVDPSELSYAGGELTAGGKKIDMIYNRLVDFAFESPVHDALRRAYLDNSVVVTPNPRVHALLADKRNLTLLSDSQSLQEWGLDSRQVGLLQSAVPKTRFVSPDDERTLWQERRKLFFKPVAGHGSKGVYRGEKVTRRVFDHILNSNYIAQDYVAPGERIFKIDETVTAGKVDIRLYTYAGRTLLTAARIYQGQTTNFRTPGGGFAPVFEV